MEQPEGQQRSGRDESQSVELGGPEREFERQYRNELRPDLDERQRQIAERRKPAGPPLKEPGEAAMERRPPDEPPVDP